MSTSNAELWREISIDCPLLHPLKCSRCGKLIPLRPQGFEAQKPFLDGNFITDAPFKGATFNDTKPRHIKCK